MYFASSVVPKLFLCAEHYKNFSVLKKLISIFFFAEDLSKSYGQLVVHGADYRDYKAS